MQREILYRGQTRKLGQKVNMNGDKQPGIWVYGGILQGKGDFSIIYGGEDENDAQTEKFVVYSDTVGEFINRKDKTDTKIFEGAIVCTENHENLDVIDEWDAKDFGYAVVEWSDQDGFVFRDVQNPHMCWNVDDDESVYALKYCKVIGNRWDNPELLEGLK